uniref:Uncharacterized protein n=1 Tax=Oryza brachyantha TaxID=4533 RepID=J3NC75_ORYBR
MKINEINRSTNELLKITPARTPAVLTSYNLHCEADKPRAESSSKSKRLFLKRSPATAQRFACDLFLLNLRWLAAISGNDTMLFRRSFSPQSQAASRNLQEHIVGFSKIYMMKPEKKQEQPTLEWLSLLKGIRNGKKVGRGTLKGLAAMAKRVACPLIGVRQWKHVSQEVKNLIVESLMSIWDKGNMADPEEKILMISKKWYKGWQSTFSATYKAYDGYDARMKLTLFEHVLWNSQFKKRDLEIGVEPGPLELWKTTHIKRDKWSNEMSETIYLFHETIQEQTREIQKLKEQLAKQAADKEAEKNNSLMQEVKAMMVQQQCNEEVEPQSFITAQKENIPPASKPKSPKLQRISSTSIMVKELEA